MILFIRLEIIDSLDNKRGGSNKSKKANILVTGILVVLTFVSVTQTVQSASILSKVDEVKASGVSSSALSSNVSDLPDMVGGC